MRSRSERPRLGITHVNKETQRSKTVEQAVWFESIRSNSFQELEMPTHCCVPECMKKGYREDDGTKVSYFKFPTENAMKKKWLHALRRDEGKHFKVTENTFQRR